MQQKPSIIMLLRAALAEPDLSPKKARGLRRAVAVYEETQSPAEHELDERMGIVASRQKTPGVFSALDAQNRAGHR